MTNYRSPQADGKSHREETAKAKAERDETFRKLHATVLLGYNEKERLHK